MLFSFFLSSLSPNVCSSMTCCTEEKKKSNTSSKVVMHRGRQSDQPAVFLVFRMQIEFVKAATAACHTACQLPAA